VGIRPGVPGTQPIQFEARRFILNRHGPTSHAPRRDVFLMCVRQPVRESNYRVGTGASGCSYEFRNRCMAASRLAARSAERSRNAGTSRSGSSQGSRSYHVAHGNPLSAARRSHSTARRGSPSTRSSTRIIATSPQCWTEVKCGRHCPIAHGGRPGGADPRSLSWSPDDAARFQSADCARMFSRS
jgi:hypothetical protein